MATITKNYGTLGADWWYSDYTDYAGGFVGSNYPIVTGRFDGSGRTYLSKAKFVMPSFDSFYKTEKITLWAELADCSNANPKPCEVFLSEKNFEASQLVTYSSANKYNISSTLINNSLARSYSYADKNQTNYTGTSHSSGYDFYYILKTDKLEAGKTYYLYFLNNNPAVNGGTQAHLRTFTFDYTEASKVSNPSISTGSLVLKPTSSVAVSWSASNAGTNNPVSKYKIFWNFGSAPTTSSHAGTLETTSTNCTFNIQNATRGQSLYLGVQAIGTLSGLDSSLITKNIGVINSLPEEPTVLISGDVLNSGTNITFTVYAGDDANTGQTKTLCYNINGTGKKSFTSPLTIKLAEMSSYGITSNGKYTIDFFTRDSLGEDSIATSVQFTVNFKPIITSSAISYKTVKDGADNDLATNAVISFELENNASVNAYLYVKSASSQNGLTSAVSKQVTGNDIYDINNNINPKTITIDIAKLLKSDVAPGNYFQFSFAVNDGNTTSENSDWLTVARRSKEPGQVSSVSIQTDAESEQNAWPNYFKNSLAVKFTTPKISEGYAELDTCIIAGISEGVLLGEREVTVAANKNYTIPLPLPAAQANKNVEIYLSIKDKAGQQGVAYQGGNLIKTSALDFLGSVNVNPTELKPLSNLMDFQITHALAQASGTKEISFQYQISSGGKSVEIDSDWVNIEVEDATIRSSISKENLSSILKELFGENPNSSNLSSVTVTATDAFNQTKKLISSPFVINFIEPPFFNGSDFKIYHNYDINGYIDVSQHGEEVPSITKTVDIDKSDLSLRMFNAKEGIILALPKATDLNNDISTYEIQLARGDLLNINDSLLDTSSLSFSPWLTLGLNELQRVSDNDYYYYHYRASDYEKNEFFYFKARVKDSKGNYSEEKISNTFIIGARTVSPVFSLGEVKVSREVGSNGYDQIQLSYELSIQDLGGSATLQGWNEEYYNKFQNFERDVSNYVPQIGLKVEISSDPSFNENYQSSQLNGTSPLLGYKNTKTIFENFPSGNSKVYVRFTLIVSYGIDSADPGGIAKVVSTSQVITYFGSIPTISHRSHKIGINSNSFGKDDVMVVENYQNNRYVVFKGIDQADPTKTYTIKIDLLKGSIEGATLNGGSW